MKFDFDPAKDAANLSKHGVSLAEAEFMEWSTALVWADDRRDYRETRMKALALLGPRVFFVAFVDRSDVRRIISLRKANHREVKVYVQNN